MLNEMASERSEPRKRKSNFDVTPDMCNKDVVDAAAILALAFAKVQNARLENPDMIFPHELGTVVFTEQRYHDRISKALTKNFEYINKKDAIENTNAGMSVDMLLKLLTKDKPVTNTKLYGGFNSMQKSGINIVQKTTIGSIQENTSVYVAGLPLDIVEKDLEILFARHGRIKKIKLYTSSDGKKKGDALVTYVRPESVSKACLQYHDRDIGDGHTLSVTKATFKGTDSSSKSGEREDQKRGSGSGAYACASSPPAPPVDHTLTQAQTHVPEVGLGLGLVGGAGRMAAGLLGQCLPVECELGEYPLALLCGVYDANDPAAMSMEFFLELEMDLMIDCCRYGKVRKIVTPDNANLLGTVAVTYEDVTGLENCYAALNGRCFDGKNIRVERYYADASHPHPTPQATTDSSSRDLLLLPPIPSYGCGAIAGIAEGDDGSKGSKSSIGRGGEMYIGVEGGGTVIEGLTSAVEVESEVTTVMAQETEDFLNSLL